MFLVDARAPGIEYIPLQTLALTAAASAQTLPPSPDGVSLPARLPETLPSSATVMLSFAATGRSSTAVTLTVTVAVETSPSASVMV